MTGLRSALRARRRGYLRRLLGRAPRLHETNRVPPDRTYGENAPEGALFPDPSREAKLSPLSAFLRLGRPKFLVYSLLFYVLGTSVVVHDGRAIDLGRWIHGVAFVWCTHLMTHYCNDYFDLAADSANLAPTGWTGGSRVLVEGHLRPITSLATAFVLLFASVALAMSMPFANAQWLAFLVIALAWFYTAPPLRFNYRGFGEVCVATVLSVAVPLLAYYLQSPHASVAAPLVGVIFPLFVIQAARMVVMNLSDYQGDKVVGKRTLAVFLGPQQAAQAIVFGQVVAYSSIVVLMVLQVLPSPIGAAMLLTLPLSVWQSQRILRGAFGDPAVANSIAFWASTHVALAAAAATFGFIVTTAPVNSRALGASITLCATILAVSCALLLRPILEDGIARSRHRAL